MARFPRLSAHFTAIAWKRAASVEVSMATSNQHELNGVSALIEMFGEPQGKLRVNCLFLRVGDEPADSCSEAGQLTWYDARERHPTRSEHRLYFTPNRILKATAPGDLLLLAQRRTGDVLLVSCPKESGLERQLLWLFGITDSESGSFAVRGRRDLDGREISALMQPLLDAIGVTEPAAEAEIDVGAAALKQFGSSLPPGAAMADFARSLTAFPPGSSADELLEVWMTTEEAAFRAIERSQVEVRLREGFSDLDAFIALALSVLNRRKARAGAALENHFCALLDRRSVPYERGAITEGRTKPDVLVPGLDAYQSAAHPPDRLAVVALKTTCKDRWTQVLHEAPRIRRKHLLTLEAAVSASQTTKMSEHEVQLVIPRSLLSSYTDRQQEEIWNVQRLVDHLATITQ